MSLREAIERDVEDLRHLVGRIVQRTGETAVARDLLTGLPATQAPREQEQCLDRAALELRRRWLRLAHRPADVTLKSPRQGMVAAVPCGETVSFGYERDLDAALLEARGPAYMQVPHGWTGDLVLWRSGQAALAGLLHWLVGRYGCKAPLTVAHAGAYFETAALINSFPQRVLRRVAPDQPADLVIAEPVWCDGQFGSVAVPPPARHVLCLDTTLVGPAYDLGPCLAAPSSPPVAFAFSSGLKLDQAGLELANVGLMRVLAGAGAGDAQAIGRELRGLRSLIGGGLTLDEMSALSAPWFMDRGYVDRYAGAIFAHNRALALAIGSGSAVFRPVAIPSWPTRRAARRSAPSNCTAARRRTLAACSPSWRPRSSAATCSPRRAARSASAGIALS